MIRTRLRLLVAALLAVSAVPASAVGRDAAALPAPPPGAISDNVTFIANVPEMKVAISVNFIGDTMFVSAATGIYAYSMKDPAKPALVGALPHYIWENEDVDVDRKRNLLFISRDPRGFTTQATPGTAFPFGMIQVIDVSIPHAMRQISQIVIGAGHTTSCINECKWLWAGGPFANKQTQPADWVGRPIIGVDLRDATKPVECPKPIDLGRNDGVTDYAHDVQVDARGIAWVSGAGGVRGYWTTGKHRNPVTGKVETADGCNPIPYAGGGTPEEATPSRFMHNSWRNLSASVDGRKGDVLYATEEDLSSSCETSGRFATYDLKGTYNGEGFKNTAKTKQRMRFLDTWTPEEQEGATGCDSAHYFTDRGDSILAYAFYNQGTRFLDVRNPRDIRQIGYFRPDDANTFAAYWHEDYVVIADSSRGIDIVKFTGKVSKKRGRAAVAELPTLVAPPRTVPSPMRFEPSPVWGYLCPTTRPTA
ncbi:MAG TPA: hypothetical protein VNA14_05400 [Mycobacteriales bacterium]|nr:hypothetical protein [Mycobacteriales bacterium]